MKIIKYESYSSLMLKKIRFYGALITVVLLLSILIWLVVDRYDSDINAGYRFLLLSISYLGLTIFYKYSRKYIDQIINNYVGKRGEDVISSILENHLDDSHVYIRNYTVPDTKIGDIDGLLIGPNGVTIIEVKFYSGEFDIREGKFYKNFKKGSVALWYNPIKQVERQKKSLEVFLNQNGFGGVPVKTLVALAHGRINHIVGPTGVYVITKDEFPSFIKDNLQKLSISTPEHAQLLADLLVNNQKDNRG